MLGMKFGVRCHQVAAFALSKVHFVQHLLCERYSGHRAGTKAERVLGIVEPGGSWDGRCLIICGEV